jgi:hypothetical protein
MSEASGSLVFLHIPKCAGTSFRDILLRRVRSDQVFSIYQDISKRAEQIKRMSEDRRRNIKLVLGHFNYGVHEYFPQPFSYITFLRHPLDMMVSHYYFRGGSPDSPYYELISKMTLDEFFHDQFERRQATNIFVRYLSGYYGFLEGEPRTPTTILEPLPDEALEVAKKNLTSHFSGFGITERFDESLVLFQQTGVLSNIYYAVQNINSKRPKEKLSDSAREYFVKMNPLDMALYDFARDVFEQRWQALGPKKDELVQQFRARNRIWGRYYQARIDLINLRHRFHHFRTGLVKQLAKR